MTRSRPPAEAVFAFLGSEERLLLGRACWERREQRRRRAQASAVAAERVHALAWGEPGCACGQLDLVALRRREAGAFRVEALVARDEVRAVVAEPVHEDAAD